VLKLPDRTLADVVAEVKRRQTSAQSKRTVVERALRRPLGRRSYA